MSNTRVFLERLRPMIFQIGTHRSALLPSKILNNQHNPLKSQYCNKRNYIDSFNPAKTYKDNRDDKDDKGSRKDKATKDDKGSVDDKTEEDDKGSKGADKDPGTGKQSSETEEDPTGGAAYPTASFLSALILAMILI